MLEKILSLDLNVRFLPKGHFLLKMDRKNLADERLLVQKETNPH